MKLDVEAIRANDRTYAKALHELCARVANTVARRASMPEYVNDLTSELLIIVLERLPEVYDGQSEIESFVWEAGRRLVLGQHRRAKREVSASEVDSDSGDAMIDNIPDENTKVAEEWTQDLVTREQALEAKRLLIEQMREASRAQAPQRQGEQGREPAHASTAPKGRPKRPKKERNPWVERSQLGYTQSAMAQALGMSGSHYRRLEDAGPAPDRLRPRLDALLQGASKILPTDSGVVLIKQWASRLGIDADDVSAMAAMLGVHRTTIFRWSTGRADPPPSTILLIEARIAALLEVRLKRTEGSR